MQIRSTSQVSSAELRSKSVLRPYFWSQPFAEPFAERKLRSETEVSTQRKASEITSLFDLSLLVDRTLAQRKAQRKAKSKSEVAQCVFVIFLFVSMKLQHCGKLAFVRNFLTPMLNLVYYWGQQHTLKSAMATYHASSGVSPQCALSRCGLCPRWGPGSNPSEAWDFIPAAEALLYFCNQRSFPDKLWKNPNRKHDLWTVNIHLLYIFSAKSDMSIDWSHSWAWHTWSCIGTPVVFRCGKAYVLKLVHCVCWTYCIVAVFSVVP